MQIIDKILNILHSISGIETVIHDTSFSVNVRLDRQNTPASILYMLNEFSVDTTKGIRRESVDVEIFFCDRVDLAAKGEVVQQKLDTLLPYVNQFIASVLNEKTLIVENETVNVKCAIGRFDCNVCGWTLEMKIAERQGGCIDGDTSGVNQIVITQNGTHNVAAYGEALVNVQNGEIRLQEKTATENGVITPDLGFNGLSKVNVQVPQPSGRISVDITRNGTEIRDVTNYESIAITTAVPTQTCNLYTGLTVEANGIYDPLTYNKDGFSTFVVNIPQPQGTLRRTITQNGVETVDVRLWENIEITTAVPDAPCQLETLNITEAPSQLQPTYTPSGEGFDQVNIDLQFSEKYETYILRSQFESVQYDVRDNDYIEITLDASMLPQSCYGDLFVTISNAGFETVNCCGYESVSIDTTQIQGFNTWKGTYVDYMGQFPLDNNTLYLITD